MSDPYGKLMEVIYRESLKRAAWIAITIGVAIASIVLLVRCAT